MRSVVWWLEKDYGGPIFTMRSIRYGYKHSGTRAKQYTLRIPYLLSLVVLVSR